MSTTVDQRVVEMQFDNKQFESGVSQTMSTLDKFKQKLNLNGAAKGLENVGAAAKNVNMNGLGAGVEAVSMKFSALQVMGVTALANITNSAVNAGKRIVSALTIDPVKTGFQEYETQINAVQTILANTKSKGSTIDDVNLALEELNRYADMTIYNFTEMTRNIGTFTAAGIDLDTSVNAIQGIANLAAVSGSTSQQASTAMYQLSQALAAGTIRLMDWNSVVNAGMGGEVFQNALKETSEALGTGAEAAIKASGSFRESLKDGWLTSEVLTETLKKFTTSGANEYVAEYTDLSVEAVEAAIKEGEAISEAAKARGEEVDAIDAAAEALAKKSGKNKQEIYDILDFARTATDAATKVKTFTQLWDVLKESAQSGWSQTWKLIVGDFEEAKELLTPLADTLTGFINKMSDARNRVLQIALDFTSPWTTMMDKLNGSGLGKIKEVADTVGDLSDKLEYYQNIVTKVWRGDYGNVDTGRYEALEKAGYDHRVVQDLVNKGLEYKLTVEDIEASHKKFGLTMETTKEETKEAASAFAELSDEQLKNAGLTDEEISLYRAMEKEASKLGISVSELADEMSKTNGRDLLIDSFKNIGSVFIGIGKAMKEAWADIFNPPSLEEMGVRLYGLLRTFKEFTESIRLTDKETGKLNENGKKIVRTFKGIFAVVDIVLTVVGGPLKIAFKALTQLLGMFDLNILDVTASIGDAVVKFRDWIDSSLDFTKIFEKVIPFVKKAAEAFKTWIGSLKETPAVQKFVSAIEGIASAFSKLTSGKIDISEFAKNLGSNLARAIKSLPEIAVQIGKDFIAGFQNGINFSISDVIKKVVSFCLDFVEGFKEALGVQSPSWKAHDTAVDFFQGFINGAKEMLSKVVGVLKTIGNKVMEVFKSLWDAITDENGKIEWEKLFAGGALIAMAWFLKQLATAFTGIAEGIGGLGDLLDNAGDAVKKFGKVLNAYSWDLKASALQKLAISIAILAASVWVLAQIDSPTQLWNAVGVIVVLAGVVVAMAFAMDKLSQASVTFDKDGAKLDGIKSGLMQIGMVLLLLAVTVKIVGSMDPEAAKQGFLRLAGLAAGLLAFLAIMGLISRYSKDMGQFSSLLLKLSFTMMLMVLVLKMVDGLSAEEMLQGVAFVAGFTLFIAAIAKITRGSDGEIRKIGGTMIALTIAMGLMVGVVKLISKLSLEEMGKGAAFAAGFAVFVKLLVWSTKVAKDRELAKVSGLVLSVSTSLLMMIGVCKIVNKLTGEEMVKGALFVAGFAVMLKALIGILSIGKEQQMVKVTGTILAMSVAIAILAAIAVALSFVPLSGLAKGVVAVGLLGLVMTGMIKALKGAQNVKASIMMMAIAIGIMAVAVAALSFIKTEKLAAASGALAMVMGMFALIEKCSKNVSKSIVTIGSMVVAVGLLAGILYLLSNNIGDSGAAINSAIALSILMGALAVSLKIVGNVGALAKSAIGPMYAMTGVLAIVALIMGALTALDVAPSLETALSLSVMLMALAGVTAVLTLVGAGAPAALGGIAAFAIVVAGVGAVMLALAGLNKLFPEMQTWLDTGIVILEKIGSGIGKFVGGLIGGIGEGLMDSLLNMVNTFETVMNKLVKVSEIGANVNLDGFTGVEKLIGVMGSIGLTTVGTTLSDIFTLGGTSMEKFQTDGVAFFTAMKAIATASAGVKVDETAIDSVIGVAQRLVNLQSSLEPIGGVISWFTGRDDLGTFGVNVGVFIEAMKTALVSLGDFNLNTEALDPIITSAQQLATLQSSLEPIGGVISWFTGRDDLGTFGVNVGVFIEAMKTALGSLDGFTANTEALDPIIVAAKSLAGLQSSLEPIGGVISWFTGRSDLGTFGVNVGMFISSMKTALGTLEGATLDEEALASVISAATELAKLQEKLEPMGGVVSWFTGRSDLGIFGTNIGLFGDAIGKLKMGMGENGISEDLITSVTNAGNAIIALQKSLPEEGWFDGKMNLTEFSNYVTDFGTAMKGFGEAAAGIDATAVDTSITTARRIKGLIESLVRLDTSGLATFTGIGKGGFGADGAAYKIGQAISKYSEEVSGIDEAAVTTSVSAANKLKSLIAGLVGLDTSGIENFKVGSIGNAMKTYGSAVSSISVDAVAKSISAAKQLRNFIASLSGLNTDGVGSFASAINELGTISTANLVKAFSGVSTKLLTVGSDIVNALVNGMKSKQGALTNTATSMIAVMQKAFISKFSTFKSAGAKLIAQLASGMTSRRSVVSSAMTAALSTAITSLRGNYQSFYNAGSYLVSGFASGISANSYKAAAKASAMAIAAKNAAKRALDINSPSKVFREIGMSVPEGFAMGIDKLSGMVTGSVKDMATNAIDNVRSSIYKIADAVNTDIDSQPKIRPILDLSDVRSGASAIGSMLSLSPSVGVAANIGAVSASMSSRGQNGAESEVVSAINKLRKDLANIGNTSYQINGVTYDDGSNIAGFANEIIRQARVQRRV